MNTNLTSIKVIKNLLKKYQLYPSKKFGQNFLISQSTLQKMIKAANLGSEDIVLEIGPGIGTLTVELAKRVKKVMAVEKDPKMIKILKEALRDFKNIKIIREDILKFKNSKLKIKNFKVVANIPYYLTSALIRKFLETDNQPKSMVLMVQKEVAQRISAQPPKMNLLAVSVQFYGQPKIIAFVSKKSFWPEPKVDSAIIKITPHFFNSHDRANYGPGFIALFFKMVKAGFSQPRKQLINNFSKMLKLKKDKIKRWLWKNNINPERRAETLTIENWINLAKTFNV